MEKIQLGLIGRNISYSFSKKYFEQKFNHLLLKNYTYQLFDIHEINQVEKLLSNKNIRGLNVTIPYKQQIIPFLDELDDDAREIGAVNCISIESGRIKGYNTDAFGFEKSLLRHKMNHHHSALVLGNGGASKAVQYVLKRNGIPFKNIARNTELNFENINKKCVENHLIIIQTTPVGTFPNEEDCLDFPYDAISSKHLIIDLIYNPAQTRFMRQASERGALVMNGFYMFEQQAEKSWEIWTK